MKKVIFTLCFVLGALASQAQIDFGIKAGLNYNSDSFNKEALTSVYTDLSEGDAKSKTGYHAGIWTRFKVPVLGVYLRPELVYTALKSEISGGDVTGEYGFQKIDIPVLIGKRFLKVAHVYAGPSFQYIIDGEWDFDGLDSTIDDVETAVDGLTAGIQLGAGVELGNIGLDVRWERGFSDVESTLLSGTAADNDIDFDTRVNQIIVSLSLKF